MAGLEQSRGRHRLRLTDDDAVEAQSWTSANTGGAQRRTSKSVSPNTMLPTEGRRRGRRHRADPTPNLGFHPETTTNSKRAKEMTTHLGDASKEVNDTHGCRRRQPVKRRAGFSSVSSSHLHTSKDWGSTVHVASHRRHRSTQPSCSDTPHG